MMKFNSRLDPKKSRILVTGGLGFIGGHVVDKLRSLDFSVTILDRFGRPNREDVDFVLGDIRDRKLVLELARSHQGIINLAAILGTSETVNHPNGAVDSNLIGALSVFDAAKEFGVRVTHITVGNYWMNNPYAITKNGAEKIALLYNAKFGTKITVVRGLNVYGSRQKATPVRKIMPNLVLPALRNEEILLYGDGEQKMDMIYIDDMTEVLVRSLLMDHGAWDQVFEAGTGVAPTINEICDAVVQDTRSQSKITHVPMRQGEPNRSIVCGNPKTLLPLEIESNQLVSLEKGIRLTSDYYKANLAQFS